MAEGKAPRKIDDSLSGETFIVGALKVATDDIYKAIHTIRSAENMLRYACTLGLEHGIHVNTFNQYEPLNNMAINLLAMQQQIADLKNAISLR